MSSLTKLSLTLVPTFRHLLRPEWAYPTKELRDAYVLAIAKLRTTNRGWVMDKPQMEKKEYRG